MAFMELDVTERCDWYEIDGDNGITYVPVNVVGVGRDVINMRDYYDGSRIDSVKIVHNQYGARYSAPGYMDQTDWTIGNNKRNLIRDVRALYED
jgi:hypothetical protein